MICCDLILISSLGKDKPNLCHLIKLPKLCMMKNKIEHKFLGTLEMNNLLTLKEWYKIY